MIHLHPGMSMRDVLSAANELGVPVRQGKGGEHVYQFPGRLMRVNSRRKDVPRKLVQKLREFAGCA